MSSFYAELHVAGHVYPLRSCTYGVHQATDGRGRTVEKVRYSLLEIMADVPADSFLESWAATAHQPLDGSVVFSDPQGGAARETVHWQAGHCVSYREDFVSGSATEGAYVCYVSIAAPKLVFSAGGSPAPFVAPAARNHEVLPKLPVIPLATSIAPAAWVGKKGLPAWNEAHKEARWAEYQRDKAGNPKAKNQAAWDTGYETVRNNNITGLGREREYAQTMGATSKVLKTPFTNRQIDMFIEKEDYCGQLKTGKIYLTDQAKIDLEKDEYLVNSGYQVEYILEKGGSKPLLTELNKIGAVVKIGPQIP
jgi:hypothetical protein